MLCNARKKDYVSLRTVLKYLAVPGASQRLMDMGIHSWSADVNGAINAEPARVNNSPTARL